MALDGRGMAWLPKSLIGEYLAAEQLVRAGDERWDIPIEIHLFRSRARLPATAEQFWATVEKNSK
jgi:DNA-binding transcriptional LysR family regulator